MKCAKRKQLLAIRAHLDRLEDGNGEVLEAMLGWLVEGAD